MTPTHWKRSIFVICVLSIAFLLYLGTTISFDGQIITLESIRKKPMSTQKCQNHCVQKQDVKNGSAKSFEHSTGSPNSISDKHSYNGMKNSSSNSSRKRINEKVRYRKESAQVFDEIPQGKNDEKLILLWNPMYKNVDVFRNNFKSFCPSANCVVTDDKNSLNSAEAVFIEVENIYTSLPKKTTMGQVWIMSDLEAPTHRDNSIKTWDNKFNWTMTYRRDSDIPLLYGAIKVNEESLKVHNNEYANKSKDILWFVSNCNTPGKRENDIHNIRKSINMDIYGKCGNVTACTKDDTNNCYFRLLNGVHRFYYSAENSRCRDYITEKVFRPYGAYIVPVIRGGANYSLYLPPNSYIDQRNFTTIEKFAKFLNSVSAHQTIYNAYFSYKRYYHPSYIHFEHRNPFCELCYRLNNQSKYRRLYKKMHEWWRGDGVNANYMCNEGELATLPIWRTLVEDFLSYLHI